MRLARVALPAILALCVIAAGPGIAAATTADLSSVLVDPPSSDFQAVPNGGSGNFGPQTADMIASNASDSTAAKQRLGRDQFTRGYEKGWVQQSTGLVLVEGAYEFKLNSGARDYFTASKSGDSANSDFKGFFDTPAMSPAYGAHFLSSDGFPSDAVVFVKGNLNLVVVMGNRNGVDTNRVLTQAKAQYSFAPANTLPQASGSGSSSSGSSVSPLALGIFTGAVLVVAVLVGVVALFMRRRGGTPAAAAAAQPLTLSGDGRYWWDGGTWHDTETSVPPGVQRSPDGAYWYDGTRWRTVPGWQPQLR